MISKLKSSNILVLISFILAIVIVNNWIIPGKFISHAEEGLVFYNPSRTLDLVKYIWYEKAFGIAVPFSSPRIPFYFVTNLLFFFGIPPYLIQALVFFFILLIPLIYLPKLLDLYLPKTGVVIGFIGALFYLFNLYTATQVFHRFLYPLMFLWSYLPLFLYLWAKWIRTNNYKYLLFFLISSVIYSYTFALPSGAIALWVSAGLLSLYEIIKTKNKKLIWLSLMGLMVWLVVNLWWIYPLYALRGNDYSSMLQSDANLNSLVEVSKFYSNQDIFYLKQKYFFENEGFFNTFASESKVQYASDLFLFLLFAGVVFALARRKLVFFVMLLLVGWFVSKGANPPFGHEFYELIFSKVSFLQVLRNPYEKFGVVFLLPYSILAAFGLHSIVFSFIKNKKNVYLSYVITLVIIFILGRPILNGDIYYGHFYIKVPEHYNETNKLISKMGDERIFHLPYRSVTNVKYVWGYEGEDTTKYLFDNSSISGTTTHKNMSEYYTVLPKIMNSTEFTNLLTTMNVGYVIVHKDLVQDASYVGWVKSSKDLVDLWKNTSELGSVGDLDIYALDKELSLGQIRTADTVIVTDNIEDLLSEMISKDFDPANQAVITSDQNLNYILFENNLSKPEIKYTKINTEKYLIEIKDADSPFVLILANSFNNMWIAEVGGGEILDNHFEINGYANGWIVDKLGSYTIEIKFKVWPWE